MPTYRAAELNMLGAEFRAPRWELVNGPHEREFMNHVKRTIVDRMLREIRNQLEQAITVEHMYEHTTDMEVWRGRVLVAIQSVQQPSRSAVKHYMDDEGREWVEGGGIRVPARAPDLLAAPKRLIPEPKFDPADLDAVLPSSTGTW